jgi:hypothetical protein
VADGARVLAASSTGSTSDAGWIFLAVAIVLLLIALGWLVYHLARRGRVSRREAASAWDSSLSRSMGSARWFADRVTLGIADRGRTGQEAGQLWGDSSPTVTDLERRLYELRQTAPDEQRASRAAGLLAAVSELRSALDRDVQLRAAPGAPDQAMLIGDSAATVMAARDQLATLSRPASAS